MPALLSPTTSNNNQYTQLLQRLNNANGSMNHHTMQNGSSSTATMNLTNGTLIGTPSGHSSQQQPILQQQPLQQPTNLSHLMLNSVSGLDLFYSSTMGSSNDILSMNQNNSNNTSSPTLEQLESMLQQQQQIQQQQNSSAASNLLANSQCNSYSTTSPAGMNKTIPIKAGNTNSKYQSPQVPLNTGTSLNSDFKVHCECGGTHLSMHTAKGLASYRNHLSTKRHQKYVADLEQLRNTQTMTTGISSGNNITNPTMMNSNHSTNNDNSTTNILQYTSSTTHPLLSNTNLLLGQNQFQSFIENTSNNSSNIGQTTSDNTNGGNSSSNSSVYGAAV